MRNGLALRLGMVSYEVWNGLTPRLGLSLRLMGNASDTQTVSLCTWLCVAMCVSSVVRNSDGDEALLREIVPQDISWIRKTLEGRDDG